MNYQNQAAANVVETPKPISIFEQVHQRLININDEQEKYLSIIEDKLHSIFNQREPQTPTGNDVKPMDSDAISRFERQISRVDNSTTRLHKIASHLEKIV